MIPNSDVVATEATHVIGLSITVSKRRVQLVTSKATVSDEASVVAKSKSKEGSKKPEDLTFKSHEEWVVLLQEHPLTLKNTLLRIMGKKTSRVRVSS